MSLSWRERLHVGLGPDAVDFARYSRGARSRLIERGALEVSQDGAEPWRGALSAFAHALPRIAVRKPSCSVVLSNHFTRSQLLPWHGNLRSPRDYEALARAHFRAVYGVAADQWEIRLPRAEYGAPVLACAVDAALLRELDTLATGAGLQLREVRPHFAVAFNRWRHACTGPACWFALVEAGRLWLGALADGAWTGVSARILGADAAGGILAAVEQEKTVAAATAAREAPVHVVTSGLDREGVRALREAGFRILASLSASRLDLGGAAVPEAA